MKRVKKRKCRQAGAPSKKYSAIFLEYVAPLAEYTDGYTAFCGAVNWAKTIWNAAALDRRDGSKLVADTKAELAQGPNGEEIGALIDFLAERRVNEFGEHEWFVGEATVRDEGEEWVVRVETRQ